MFISVCSLYAQTADQAVSPRVARIEKIYRSLEYNTTSFNDLKQTWIVTDPVYVREIFNRFVVKNALRINGRKPTLEEVEARANYIYNGNVFIDIRRRFYDDELEVLRFFKETRLATSDTSEYFFDAIKDFVFIKDILGNDLYLDLKKQMYALNDITKTSYDTKPAFNFNIYLHLYEPELMFWSTTTNGRNKYLASAFGTWGNDHISLPGWYFPDYVAGFRLAYADSIVNSIPVTTYSVEAGVGIPAIQPNIGVDNFTGRKLEHSGPGFYLKAEGQPFKQISEKIPDFNVSLTAYFTIGTNKAVDFDLPVGSKFFSTRNYFDFFLRKDNLSHLSEWGNVYAGVGFSAFDVKYYQITGLPEPVLANSIFENGFRYAITTEAGLSNVGGLLSHNVGVLFNYSLSEKTVYLGLKTGVMISNSVGFDFKVMTPIQVGGSLQPTYRSDTYLVFSPIIRINY